MNTPNLYRAKVRREFDRVCPLCSGDLIKLRDGTVGAYVEKSISEGSASSVTVRYRPANGRLGDARALPEFVHTSGGNKHPVRLEEYKELEIVEQPYRNYGW